MLKFQAYPKNFNPLRTLDFVLVVINRKLIVNKEDIFDVRQHLQAKRLE
jgi:hypothetical protein